MTRRLVAHSLCFMDSLARPQKIAAFGARQAFIDGTEQKETLPGLTANMYVKYKFRKPFPVVVTSNFLSPRTDTPHSRLDSIAVLLERFGTEG